MILIHSHSARIKDVCQAVAFGQLGYNKAKNCYANFEPPVSREQVS